MNHWHLSQAARAVRQGGVIAYPTEAVFGLGCDVTDEAAIDRLLVLKSRSLHKGLIVIASSVEQLETLIYFPNEAVRQQVTDSWPGPHTWILPTLPTVLPQLCGAHQGLAVRVTAHSCAQRLCRETGPLVSTSANISGRRPARNAAQVRQQFGQSLDYILPGPVDRQANPSSIRDACTGQRLR